MRPVDGGEAVRLSGATQAKFSPDARSVIALTPPLAGPQQVLLLPVGEGVTRQLTFTAESHSAPSFADPTTVLFVQYDRGSSQVWRMATDGSGARSLGAEGCEMPTADPSGKEFLCAGGPTSNVLFRFPTAAKGTGRRLYALLDGDTFLYARWSGDGSKVFAVTGQRQWLTIDAATGRLLSEELIVLGEGVGSDSLLSAAFSPDAAVQAYSFDRFSSGLYLADGL